MPKNTDKEQKTAHTKTGSAVEDENTGRAKKIFAVVVAILIIVAIIAALILHTNSNSGEQTTADTQSTDETATALSESETVYQSSTAVSDSTTAGDDSTTTEAESSTTAADDTTETESSTGTTAATTAVTAKTTKQAQGYSLPLSINQALNALEDHYGSGYKINSTVTENGYNYFAIYYENGEKYASVQVDLSTGEAEETLAETNEVTAFYLV